MTKRKFAEMIKKIDPFMSKAEDLDVLFEHINTVMQEFRRLEDLEDETIELNACIEHHKDLEQEFAKALKQQHRENDHKLRTIWLMAEEIRLLREHNTTCFVEDIVKEYLDEAKLSRDNDGDHIPRID